MQKRIFTIMSVILMFSLVLCPSFSKDMGLFLNDGDIAEETATIASENGLSGNTIASENCYVAGLKVDVRSLFSDTSNISGFRIKASDKAIAKCSKAGIFKGKKTGTATVEAYSSDKTTISSTEIRVVKQKLNFPKKITASYLDAADALAFKDCKPDEWLSSKPSVASIDPKTGVVTVNRKGRTKIKAVYKSGSNKKIISKKIKIKAVSEDAGKEGTTEVEIETPEGKKTVKVTYLQSEAEAVFSKVNDYRKEKSLYAFSKNPELQKVADIRAAELVVKYSHTRPNGDSCFSLFPDYMAVAENIAMGQSSADEVMKSWKNSPGHNANMLDSSCSCLAVSCVSYKGKKYWVQCFYLGIGN